MNALCGIPKIYPYPNDEGCFHPMDNDCINWFAVRTMYRNDMNVARYLETQGAEVFIPMHYVDVVRGGVVRRMLEPVIRNLVFVRTSRSLLDRVKLELESKWAIRLFMNHESREPIVIPEEQMRSFIAVAGTYDEQLLFLGIEEVGYKVGDRIRIIAGPFRGAQGRLLRIKGHKRLVVEVESIMAVATAYIPPQMVEKIG